MAEESSRTPEKAAAELAATINAVARARASEADDVFFAKMDAQLDARINALVSRRLEPLIDAVAFLLGSALGPEQIQAAFLKQRIEEARQEQERRERERNRRDQGGEQREYGYDSETQTRATEEAAPRRLADTWRAPSAIANNARTEAGYQEDLA